MSARPFIAVAVCVPFVIGAAMRGGTDETPAAPKPAAPVPLAAPAAPSIEVPDSDHGFPDLKPKPTPRPKPKPTPGPQHPTPPPRTEPQPPRGTPTPAPSPWREPAPRPRPTPDPHGPIMCVKAPCPQGGGED